MTSKWTVVRMDASDVSFKITRSDETSAASLVETFVWVYVDIDSDICVISVRKQSIRMC